MKGPMLLGKTTFILLVESYYGGYLGKVEGHYFKHTTEKKLG